MIGWFPLFLGTLALVSAALAVTRPSVVHGLMWLVAALLSLAATFFALGAGFAGAVQILIYAGAILAVFVFVVMTFDASPPALARERLRLKQAARWPLLMVLALGLPLAFGLWGGAVATGLAPGGRVPVQAVGGLLFGPWAVAVEIASFLLIAALLGARHLVRRDPPTDSERPAP
ncbi:MAG: NADH-quinone oxidoreductase subunit J [Rhodobacteraceae bacterium]|nr:NADH-quinone oxidoreductase subunit J [Paracoccaceae bacterium]